MIENKGYSNIHLLDGALLTKNLDQVTETRTPEEIVAGVLAELGKKFTAFGNRVLVRTDPPITMSPGGLLLTDRETSFWFGQAHSKFMKCTVIAAGDRTAFVPGDRILCQRLHFAWITKLSDGTFFGFIANKEVVGYIEDETMLHSQGVENV